MYRPISEKFVHMRTNEINEANAHLRKSFRWIDNFKNESLFYEPKIIVSG
jgi:hypothetical protein